MKRLFSSTNKAVTDTTVCIVGCGPVGMTLSAILNKFKVPNMIIERSTQL